MLEKLISELCAALDKHHRFSNPLGGICKSIGQCSSKPDLQQMKENIMSQITDWASGEQADLAAISGTLDGIVAGIIALDTLITNLQNSQGTLSPSDQTALNAIQAASTALKAKSAGIVVTPPPTS